MFGPELSLVIGLVGMTVNSPRLRLPVASLLQIIDVALITWVSTSTCWPLLTATLLMRFEKLCCIGYSVLIGLGVILLPLLQACIAHRT